MPWTSLLSAFLLALLGGLHCAAMCGGVVSAFAFDRSLPGAGWSRLAAISSYHLGRMLSYCALGVLAGAASGTLLPWREIRAVQLSLYGVAAAVMLWLAWRLWNGRQAWPSLERWAGRVLSPLRRRLWPGLHSGHGLARIGAGMMWGMVPCGMVYGALALALLSGSALWGGLLMLVFWAGTVPNLVLADWLFARAARSRGQIWRRGGALLIAGFGAWALYAVFFDRERIAASLFCALP